MEKGPSAVREVKTGWNEGQTVKCQTETDLAKDIKTSNRKFLSHIGKEMSLLCSENFVRVKDNKM